MFDGLARQYGRGDGRAPSSMALAAVAAVTTATTALPWPPDHGGATPLRYVTRPGLGLICRRICLTLGIPDVEWYLGEAWALILFHDHDRAAAQRRR